MHLGIILKNLFGRGWRRIRYIINSFSLEKKVERILNLSSLSAAIATAVGNQIEGDYLEFGVFKGDSLIYACSKYAECKRAYGIDKKDFDIRFFAFDSFEGLPKSHEAYLPNHYFEGAYKASLNEFKKNLAKNKFPLERLVVVPGFYDKTLNSNTKKQHKLNKVSVAYIDCDLYKSAKPVFNFLTDILQTGSIIVIDDWFKHRGIPEYGIQKAFNEWLSENRNISVTLLHQYGRIAFIVNKKNNETA